MTGLSNCTEFHHLMMALSHSVKTEMCFIFHLLQMRRFFFFISFLFAEARATFLCFFVFLRGSSRCYQRLSVCISVLVEQLATFALPSAAEAEGTR